MLADSQAAEGPLAIHYENRTEDETILRAFYPNGDYTAYGVRPEASFPDEAKDGVILTYGAITAEALRAAEQLRAKGLSVGVLLLETLAPYESTAERILPYLDSASRILFLEEGIRDGGAGMLIGDRLAALGVKAPYTVLAIDGHFASPDHITDLRTYCRITAEDAVACFLPEASL